MNPNNGIMTWNIRLPGELLAREAPAPVACLSPAATVAPQAAPQRPAPNRPTFVATPGGRQD